MKIENTQGQIFYGMHFYPGVAEYAQPGSEPLRVFLNEDTIRKMDATFAGKPVFVEHVDEVQGSLDKLNGETDGWVVRSFYNAADGKHWVEFIVVSERGLKAIESGFRLSNAYIPKGPRGGSGLWNGVEYQEQILDGEYEHLALVSNPRYDESVVMNCEQFKKYNEDKQVELKRLANSKQQGETRMKLNFFKRAKVENSADLEGTSVLLPQSKKEMTIVELVEKMDKIENMHGYAAPEHMVKVGNEEMSVGDLVKKHENMAKEIEAMKKMHDEDDEHEEEEMKHVENDPDEADTVAEGEKDVGDRGGDKSLDNEDEEDEEKKSKKMNAIEKAKKLKNSGAHMREEAPAPTVLTGSERVALGKKLFGK